MIPPSVLLAGYCQGIFPMALQSGEIGWFSPDPRAILPLDEFHAPHGLKRALRNADFELHVDRDFEQVIRACASRIDTWINDEIIESYCNLHRLGFAHSVEVWREKQLTGGLYGVSIGGAFFGESMFHVQKDASKIALAELIRILRENRFILLDVQWVTEHLSQFGVTAIPRRKYLDLLTDAITRKCVFRR